LVLINNLGQIVPAIGGRAGIEDTLVSILSVCNCLGRLACGFVGDLALARWGTPRPVVFGWFIGLMVLAMGCLALAHPLALYAASAVGGFSYGAINGITPPIYSEVFGLRSFGAICQWSVWPPLPCSPHTGAGGNHGIDHNKN
jgi:MFS family permease